MPDRRWTPAELEAALRAGRGESERIRHGLLDDRVVCAVLDAAAPLVAARVRADEREALARMLVDHAAREPDGSVDQVVMLHAAELVRAHATTPTTEEDPHA